MRLFVSVKLQKKLTIKNRVKRLLTGFLMFLHRASVQ